MMFLSLNIFSVADNQLIMVWSWKRRIIVSCTIGWTLTILGAIMIPVLEYVIKKKVQNVGWKSWLLEQGCRIIKFYLSTVK